MAEKLKVGDRFKILPEYGVPEMTGELGTVVHIGEDGDIPVKTIMDKREIMEGCEHWYFYFNEVEKYDPYDENWV